AEFQNLLIQCTQQISPLDLRFYFQEGLKPSTTNHLREIHPQTLDESIQLAICFDHNGQGPVASTTDWEKNAICHRCKQPGHIAPNCPTK
ncbi:hypothetical protein PHMEG_00026830, partial [Phytophthora megakarya]